MTTPGEARRAWLGPTAVAAAAVLVAAKPPMTPELRAALRVLRRPPRSAERSRTELSRTA
jgi:hypothetical protein